LGSLASRPGKQTQSSFDQAELRKPTKQGELQPLGLPLPTLAGLVYAGWARPDKQTRPAWL